MQLATLRHADGTSAAARVHDTWHQLRATDLSSLLTASDGDLTDVAPGERLRDAAAVLPLPHPAKVLCCGLNYGDHIAETGREKPSHPTLFAKYADTLIGPDDDIRAPAGADIDWEAELAVVVGSPLRDATAGQAQDAIAGYTVANDISVRDWQYRTTQWLQGKIWDATTPVGPVLVTPDEIDPRDGVDVICRVNGEEMQRGNTRTLVFDAAALLAYVSSITALRPGDLVLTGTPGGVGVARDPQRFLADGDVVETEIPGIGTLRNTLRLRNPGDPTS